jgi:hypothetical protein
MDNQDKFVKHVMDQMGNVLIQCNKNKNDCICVARVRYLKDRHDLPEHKKYMTEVFCDERGTSFHINIGKELDEKRKSIAYQ